MFFILSLFFTNENIFWKKNLNFWYIWLKCNIFDATYEMNCVVAVSMVCFIAMAQLSLRLLCFVCMMLLRCICGIPLPVMYVWLIVFCQQLAMVTSQSSDLFSAMLLYSCRILCYSEKLSDWHLFSSSLGKVQIKPATTTLTSVFSRCMVVKCMNSRKCWFHVDNFCNHTLSTGIVKNNFM